jgi:hypothetical protein
MSELFKMTIANWPAMLRGLADAKKLQLRYMRSELKRGAQRIRKSFIDTQLKGPPGITAGPLAKGKNIWTYVHGGGDEGDLFAKIGISRILHVHEIGLTIKARRGKFLFLHVKGKKSAIFARVEQVTIPARLHFVQEVRDLAPGELAKVAEAGARGVEVGISRALKKTI